VPLGGFLPSVKSHSNFSMPTPDTPNHGMRGAMGSTGGSRVSTQVPNPNKNNPGGSVWGSAFSVSAEHRQLLLSAGRRLIYLSSDTVTLRFRGGPGLRSFRHHCNGVAVHRRGHGGEPTPAGKSRPVLNRNRRVYWAQPGFICDFAAILNPLTTTRKFIDRGSSAMAAERW